MPGKVLIILSDAHAFAVTKSDGTVVEEETGFFLMELAKPLAKLLDAGYEVTFASPEGKQPNIDPLSKSLPLAFLGMWWEKNKESELIKKMQIENNLNHPRPFASITDEELKGFSGIFIPGGHAPMTDLGDNAELGRIILHFHSQVKPTAIICHGPYALLSTRSAPGSTGFAYEGYTLTSWSDQEEAAIEVLKGGKIERVQTALREAGAKMTEGIAPKVGAISVDREVVSGANPMAAAALGDKFVEMLAKA